MSKSSPAEHSYEPLMPGPGRPPQLKEPSFVSGFGAVDRSDLRDLKVQIRLTAFRDPERWNDDTVPLTERLDPARELWDVIPLGLLPYIRVGDVWKDGKPLATPAYEYVEFYGLDVTPPGVGGKWRDEVQCEVVWDSAMVTVVTGENETAQVPLVPSKAFRITPPPIPGYAWEGKHGPGARYLRMTVPGTTDVLLLPCTEVARHYYATSSNLAHSVFTEFQRSTSKAPEDAPGVPRHLDELYNLAESRVLGAHTKQVQLRMRFENEDGFVAGRLRYDDLARARALSIGAALTRREEAKLMPMIEAYPPYVGQTSFGVHGTWLEAEVFGRRVRHFLAFRIALCGGPVPFEHLVIVRDNSGGTSGPDGEGEGGGDGDAGGSGPGGGGRRRGTPSPTPSDGEIVRKSPLPSLLTGLKKTVLPKVEYTATFSVRPLVRKGTGESAGWGTGDPGGDVDGVSPQPGTHRRTGVQRLSVLDGLPKSRNPPLEELLELPPLPPPPPAVVRIQLSLESFREAAGMVAGEAGWNLVWVNPSSSSPAPDGVEFPLTDDQARRPAWSYLQRDGAEGERRRRVLIAEFSIEGRYVYVLEAERRRRDQIPALLIVGPGGRKLASNVFVFVLKQAVERGAEGLGIWGEPLAGIAQYTRIHHGPRPATSDTDAHREYTKSLAKHLRTKIQKALEGATKDDTKGNARSAKNPQPGEERA